MIIRGARETDWEACLELDLSYETEATWQMEVVPGSNVRGMAFREIRLPRKQKVAHPMSFIATPLKCWQSRDKFWVAVEKREVIGYIGVRLETIHNQVRITELGVAPEFRRKGIATALLKTAAEWCIRQHVDQIVLECPIKAHPAISFALKHRFVFCGFQESYWSGQEVGLFFRQRLRK
ncbi:MAG: GNAT family N-acetyltransferase [Anaerolineae bacterium]|nr:GNAT family N-acetyltransferase [Anaerolineae bacterium]